MRESDVQLLGILSQHLKMELAQEKCQPYLVMHPFFKEYVHSSPSATRLICNKSVCLMSYSEGDTVFADDSRANGMYFLVTGRLRYIQASSSEKKRRSNPRK